MVKPRNDLTGMTFGHLIVIEQTNDYIKPNGVHEVENKEIYLGAFASKDDAIKTRLEAEAKHFGEFAPQRHLFEEYGITTIQN